MSQTKTEKSAFSKALKYFLIFIALTVIGSLTTCAVIGWAVWEIATIPSYISVENIMKSYGDDIKKFDEALDKKQPLTYQKLKLHDDILDIVRERNRRRSSGPTEPVYRRFSVKSKGRTTSVNCGHGKLEIDGKIEECVVLVRRKKLYTYYIFIRDTIKPGKPD